MLTEAINNGPLFNSECHYTSSSAVGSIVTDYLTRPPATSGPIGHLILPTDGTVQLISLLAEIPSFCITYQSKYLTRSEKLYG